MHNYAMGKLPLSFANMCNFNYESQANIQTRQLNLIVYQDAIQASLANFLNIISPSQTKKKIKDTFLSAYAHSVVCSNSHCIECRN